jgi:hypothetical protein
MDGLTMKMPDDVDDGLVPVNSRDEIPRFSSEDEEREFWATHCFGEKLLAEMREGGVDAVWKRQQQRLRKRQATRGA